MFGRQDDCVAHHKAVVFDLASALLCDLELLQLLFRMLRVFHPDAARPYTFFLSCCVGMIRPGTAELLRTLDDWQKQGRIDEVCIFTSATDEDGCITFLKRCVELHAHRPHMFGRCITGCSRKIETARGLLPCKDLGHISASNRDVVLIDTVIENVVNGYVIRVPPHQQQMTICMANAMSVEPKHAALLCNTVHSYYRQHRRPLAPDRDLVCQQILQILSRIF